MAKHGLCIVRFSCHWTKRICHQTRLHYEHHSSTANSWIVGYSSLTGLWKSSPRLGSNRLGSNRRGGQVSNLLTRLPVLPARPGRRSGPAPDRVPEEHTLSDSLSTRYPSFSLGR